MQLLNSYYLFFSKTQKDDLKNIQATHFAYYEDECVFLDVHWDNIVVFINIFHVHYIKKSGQFLFWVSMESSHESE